MGRRQAAADRTATTPAARPARPVVATFSVVAHDPAAGQWGVAVASKFLAAAALVSWAEAGAGAVATQAYGNPRYGSEGLALLRAGVGADEVVARLTAADPDRDQRQLGVVDAAGRAAAFTGSACHAWAGHLTGPGFSMQGNILAGPAVLEAMAAALAATGTPEAGAGAGAATPAPLAGRLLAALAAGDAAGGDRRGRQSAGLLVVERDGGYGGLWDRVVDLRVDDHPAPVAELARLAAIHERLFGQTPAAEWVPVDSTLAVELVARLAALGHDGPLAGALASWAGVENLEERVAGADRIDPVVLAELRAAVPGGDAAGPADAAPTT